MVKTYTKHRDRVVCHACSRGRPEDCVGPRCPCAHADHVVCSKFERMEPACPECPLCGNPPQMLLDATAFCGTEGCDVLSWNRELSKDENLRQVKEVDWSDLNGDDV